MNIQQLLKLIEKTTLTGVSPKEHINGILKQVRTDDREDEIVAWIIEYTAWKVCEHTNYGLLAGSLLMTNHQTIVKRTAQTYADTVKILYENVEHDGSIDSQEETPFSDGQSNTSAWKADGKYGIKRRVRDIRSTQKKPLISKTIYDLCGSESMKRFSEAVQKAEANPAPYSYFAASVFFDMYTIRHWKTKQPLETIERALMTIAIGIGLSVGVDFVLELFEALRTRAIVFGTQTMFSAGRANPSPSSCFLTEIPYDSMESIFDTLKDVAIISKNGGGVGISVSKIRGAGSLVGDNSISTGLTIMPNVYGATAQYCDRGCGKRKGACALFLEIWHTDIMPFVEMRMPENKDPSQVLSLGIMIPDLFWKRWQKNQEWTLFSPDTAPGLDDVWGWEFEKLFEKYEKEGLGVGVVSARKLLRMIGNVAIRTGMPYMMNKDTINRCSNQNHELMIRANLCTEIVQGVSKDEIAVCNIATVSLKACVENGTFNHDKLAYYTSLLVKAENLIIDHAVYQVKKCEASNKRHRAMGIGPQGLADVFFALSIPFDSAEACKLNREISETMYYSAVKTSALLAKTHGVYKGYKGSNMDRGILHFDHYAVKPGTHVAYREQKIEITPRHDWDELRVLVKKHGMCNALLIAHPPTATSSSVMDNVETTEPIPSNVFTRKLLEKEFAVANPSLAKALEKHALYTDEIRKRILANRGSIQGIEEIPQEIRAIFKTAYEIGLETQITFMEHRAPFIDQNASFNLYKRDPTVDDFIKVSYIIWKSGIKSSYYWRTGTPSVGHNPSLLGLQQTSDSILKPIDDPICDRAQKTTLVESNATQCTDEICFSCQ